jgi:hypothetical protein
LLKSKYLSWDEQASKAFEDIKVCLAKATMLSYPKLDAPISIMSDASNVHVEVETVLQQFIKELGWHPISYFSCKTFPVELRLNTAHSTTIGHIPYH